MVSIKFWNFDILQNYLEGMKGEKDQRIEILLVLWKKNIL